MRWRILAALTLARVAMALAFQSVAALAAPMMAEAGLDWGEIGVLVGAFMAPGVVAALVGGWLGQRFGVGRVAVAGLVTMALSGLAMAAATGFPTLLAARLAVGAGAVALNVMLTRMAADWFPGRELPTAMGVLSSSWPLGIALALVVLPPLGAATGWRAAFAGNAALGLLAAAMLAAAWRVPARTAAPAEAPGGLTRHETALTLLAGLVWGLYNVALVSVLSFGADLLVARGRDPVSAAAGISSVSWACVATIALGGWIASRSGRPGLVTGLSLGATAAALAALAVVETASATTPLLIVAGLAFGPAAGPILALTADIARERVRTLATGVFFAFFYALFASGPALVGLLREATGAPETAILAAAAMLALAAPLYALFRLAPPVAPTAQAAA